MKVKAAVGLLTSRTFALSATVLVSGLAMLLFVASARATTASWSFEPSSWDFGVRLPNTGPSAAKAFTLTNTGEVEVHTLFVSLGGEAGAGFALAGNTCGNLVPGASCAIEVTFDPSGAGYKTGQLLVSQLSDEVAPAAVALSGTGAGPAASLAADTLSFDPLEVGDGPSMAKRVTLANEGQLDLTISSLSIEEEQVPNVPGASPEQFHIAGGSCTSGLVVASEASCTVDVTFSPSIPGALAADLRIVDNAPRSPQLVALKGRGVAPPFALPLVAPTIPPTAAIYRRPAKTTASRSAAFWFRASPTAARFLCKLDSQTFRACESPLRYHLRIGWHRLAVRAIDGNGLIGAAAVYRWRILG